MMPASPIALLLPAVQVKGIMIENIEKVLERGEKLDLLGKSDICASLLRRMGYAHMHAPPWSWFWEGPILWLVCSVIPPSFRYPSFFRSPLPVDKTEVLQEGALGFRREARRMHRTFWWRVSG